MTQMEMELRAILARYGLHENDVDDLASSLDAWYLRHALASCADVDDLEAQYGGQWGGVDGGPDRMITKPSRRLFVVEASAVIEPGMLAALEALDEQPRGASDLQRYDRELVDLRESFAALTLDGEVHSGVLDKIGAMLDWMAANRPEVVE